MTPPPAGSWRYQTVSKTRWSYVVAVVLGLGLHAAMLYGFNSKPVHARTTAAPKTEAIVQMEMPPAPPEEAEEKPTELAEEPTPTVAVPQLADVPSAVALNDFTQAIDLRPHAEIDANALKSMTIPVNHGRGGNGFAGNGSLFKLSDLDRIPQAVAQPAPNFPQNLRDGLDEGEVIVSFIVDSQGRVIEPKVVSSSAREFENAAISGVLRWKFNPGMKGGRRVATLMEVPLKFQLTDAQ
jgi:protein TonB